MPNLAYNTWYLPNNRVGITSVRIASVNTSRGVVVVVVVVVVS